MPHPTDSIARLPSSGIREILDLALASTADVVRLEIGEPDFSTPAHIVEAGFESARAGSSYVQSNGTPALRCAIRDRLSSRYGLTSRIEQIVVTQGAVQAIQAILSAVVAPGDEVLIPDPAWPNYEMQTMLLGATAVFYGLRAEAGFQPDLAEIESLITAKTRVIVLNSPSNPTGAVMPAALVRQLVELAVRHDLLVISDEVYDELIFEGQPANAAQYAPEQVAAVYSFSKTYAMTGWRVGYAALPSWLADPVFRVVETSLSCVSSVTQAAALAALTGPQDAVSAMRDSYRSRRDAAVSLLTDAGFEVARPQGAFYLMLPLAEGAPARLCALDLVAAGLAVAPGTAFGAQAPHHLRVSLAASEPEILEGLRRFLRWREQTEGGLVLGRSAALTTPAAL